MTDSIRIFVCSTFSDLAQERESVLDAIHRLKLLHASMEFFGARAEQPIETCLQEVQASDILVVIVGHQYGSIVPDRGVSYSEAEYAEGFRLSKPCLVYIRSDDVPILPQQMEQDPEKLRLLKEWKARLQSRHTPHHFQTVAKLAVQVAADLSREIAKETALHTVAEPGFSSTSVRHNWRTDVMLLAGHDERLIAEYGNRCRSDPELEKYGIFASGYGSIPNANGGMEALNLWIQALRPVPKVRLLQIAEELRVEIIDVAYTNLPKQ